MSRIGRLVAVGVPHHVTQRGNYRQQVFFSDEDRRVYLGLLRKYSVRYEMAIWGFCLMPNHVHLVVAPQREDSMARAIGQTNWRYAQYVHVKRQRQGHLWQSRFYSCPLGPAHLALAMRYVEQNPVRADLAGSAVDYEWSSARAHVIGKDSRGLLDLRAWHAISPPEEWAQFLGLRDSEEEIRRLIRSTHRGRPFGDEEFVADLRTRLGREVLSRPVGRPPKALVKSA
ncbi:MAG: transposase [Bryobacteraceae bacterium]